MLRLIALAFMPTFSVTFGVLVVAILGVPTATDSYSRGAWLIDGSAALSVAISLPLAWLVARQMLSRRERRHLSAGASPEAILNVGAGKRELPPA